MFSGEQVTFNNEIDIVWMRRGYELAQAKGTAQWWVGGWIHTWADFYYRPLVSHFHYFQFWMLDRSPVWVTTLISMLLYSGVVFLASVLAFRLTSRAWVAYVTAFCMAAFPLNGHLIWLAYFPYADSLFSVLFQLGALLCFFQFLTDQRHRWLILAWCAFLASGLCKEQGWITPLLMGAIVLLFPLSRRLQLVYYSHVALFCLAAGVMFKYARSVANVSPKSTVRWPIQNVWFGEMIAGNWWLVAIGFSIIAAVAAAVVYRARLNTPARRLAALGVLASCIATALLFSPSNGLDRGVYASIYIMDHAPALIDGAWSLMLYAAAAWLMFRARHQPVVVLLLCFVVGVLPGHMVGVPFWSARTLLFLPFLVPLLCEAGAIVAEHVKAIAPAYSKSSQSSSSRFPSSTATSADSVSP